MHQALPLVLLLYILDSSSSGEVEETTLLRMDLVLSTEPTIFHYPRTEPGSDRRARHFALRDVGGLPVPSSSPRYPPQIPSYAPPSRTGFFTPPLPPEYLNPFAGKPTLRGSNSESSHGQRRPIPPPPLPRPPDRQDRVPLPPPDFPVPEMKPSGKKALNTPSRPNSHQTFETAFKDVLSSAKSENSNSRQLNETDFEFVPILQYPSVSRILSGSSGRKHDLLDGDRHSGPNSRHGHHSFEQMAKNLPPLKEFVLPALPPPPRPVEIPRPPPPPPVNTTVPKNRTEVIPVVKVDDVIKKAVNESVPEETTSTERDVDAVADQEVSSGAASGGGAARLWALAWDVHVYLAATLFAVLAGCATVHLILLRCRKHLLPRTCVVTVLVLVVAVGVLRAVYLFHDAYNSGRSFPPSAAHLLLNAACPLITAAFGALFLFLVRLAEARVVRPLGHPLCLLLVALCHLALCVCVDVSADLSVDPEAARWLPLLCQAVYIILCVSLGAGYLYMYKTLASAAARKQVEVFGSVYTTDVRRSRPAALGLAVRLGLAVAMLVLLMALVQVAGKYPLKTI